MVDKLMLLPSHRIVSQRLDLELSTLQMVYFPECLYLFQNLEIK